MSMSDFQVKQGSLGHKGLNKGISVKVYSVRLSATAAFHRAQIILYLPYKYIDINFNYILIE